MSDLVARISGIDPAVFREAGLDLPGVTNLLLNLHRASPEEQAEVLRQIEVLVDADNVRQASSRFLPFVRQTWHGFKEGAHIKQMATSFEEIAEGKSRRLIINMPPRHSKSELGSVRFPAWYIGRFPERKIMIATHTVQLAQSFGAKIRNLISSQEYQRIFPNVSLAEDTRAKGLWMTNHGGEFFAAGVGSAIAGRGADLLVMDDLYSEQDARDGEYNPEVWEKVWQWYLQGPRQRLQPNAAMLNIQTRWSQQDISERLLAQDAGSAKQKWKVIRFPAILPSGRQLWPEMWSLPEIEAIKEEMEPAYWEAQYQQNPTSEVVAIIKRGDWILWDGPLPDVEFVLAAVDTAHGKDKTSDFSAITTWGIFQHEIDGVEKPCAIMLDAERRRVEYPELKQWMLSHNRDHRPDIIIIEVKAAGAPLAQELRRMGVPLQEFIPTRRTGNKARRLRQVSDIFAAGRVFYPDRNWAREVIEEVASFPKGANDDYVDTLSMSMQFVKDGNFIPIDTPDDEVEDEDVVVEAYY